MFQDEAGVGEIECPVWKWACDDVVASHLDVGEAKRLEKTRVNVGGQYVTGRAHTFRQPTGDRAQAAADLEAPPPIRDARSEKMTDGVRIVEIGECCEPRTRVRRGVVEYVHQRPPLLDGGFRPMIRAISCTCCR